MGKSYENIHKKICIFPHCLLVCCSLSYLAQSLILLAWYWIFTSLTKCRGHWSLLVLCNFGETNYLGTPKGPRMLLLDSLRTTQPKRLPSVINRFDPFSSSISKHPKKIWTRWYIWLHVYIFLYSMLSTSQDIKTIMYCFRLLSIIVAYHGVCMSKIIYTTWCIVLRLCMEWTSKANRGHNLCSHNWFGHIYIAHKFQPYSESLIFIKPLLLVCQLHYWYFKNRRAGRDRAFHKSSPTWVSWGVKFTSGTLSIFILCWIIL